MFFKNKIKVYFKSNNFYVDERKAKTIYQV
jgi:hypothetical protein